MLNFGLFRVGNSACFADMRVPGNCQDTGQIKQVIHMKGEDRPPGTRSE